MAAQNDLKDRPNVVNGTAPDQFTGRPLTPAPSSSTARTEVTKLQLKNFNPAMVSQSVNKTALHPGGVQ